MATLARTWPALVLGAALALPPSVAFSQGAGPVVAVFRIQADPSVARDRTLDALTEVLDATLAETTEYSVVPRDSIASALRAQKKASYKECYDEACQIEIGKEVAAEIAVSTRISRLGSRCVITLKAYDLKTAATAWARTEEVDCAVDGLLGGVRKVARPTSAKASGATGAGREGAARSPSTDPKCWRERTEVAEAGVGPDETLVRSTLDALHSDGQALDPRATIVAVANHLTRCLPELTVQVQPGGVSFDWRRQIFYAPAGTSNSKADALSVAVRRIVEWLASQPGLEGQLATLQAHAASALARHLDPRAEIRFPMTISASPRRGGIGVGIELVPGGLMVTSPQPLGSAERAGVQVGDIIRAVDGADIRGVSLQKAVGLLRGEPGEPVRLLIQRGPRTVRVTVARSEASTLDVHRLPTGTLHIVPWRWSASTATDIAAAIAKDPRASLILDLRVAAGFPSYKVIADVLRLFIDRGPLFEVEQKTRFSFDVPEDNTGHGGLIVVLVSPRTEGANELVSAVLKARGRAWLIGARSRGRSAVSLAAVPVGQGAAMLVKSNGRVRVSGLDFAGGAAPDVTSSIVATGHSLRMIAIAEQVIAVLSKAPSEPELATLKRKLLKSTDVEGVAFEPAAAVNAPLVPGRAHLRMPKRSRKDRYDVSTRTDRLAAADNFVYLAKGTVDLHWKVAPGGEARVEVESAFSTQSGGRISPLGAELFSSAYNCLDYAYEVSAEGRFSRLVRPREANVAGQTKRCLSDVRLPEVRDGLTAVLNMPFYRAAARNDWNQYYGLLSNRTLDRDQPIEVTWMRQLPKGLAPYSAKVTFGGYVQCDGGFCAAVTIQLRNREDSNPLLLAEEGALVPAGADVTGVEDTRSLSLTIEPSNLRLHQAKRRDVRIIQYRKSEGGTGRVHLVETFDHDIVSAR